MYFAGLAVFTALAVVRVVALVARATPRAVSSWSSRPRRSCSWALSWGGWRSACGCSHGGSVRRDLAPSWCRDARSVRWSRWRVPVRSR
ncbi:hypothetical protein NKG05_05805 [Oerskovia sp. M15]